MMDWPGLVIAISILLAAVGTFVTQMHSLKRIKKVETQTDGMVKLLMKGAADEAVDEERERVAERGETPPEIRGGI